MKVKTNFKQMVLVDHLLYNKLDSISKPDVHVQHVRTPIINSFPPNPILPPTSPPSNVAPPPPNYSAPPIAPISEPSHPNTLHVPNNEWETQAHQHGGESSNILNCMLNKNNACFNKSIFLNNNWCMLDCHSMWYVDDYIVCIC